MRNTFFITAITTHLIAPQPEHLIPAVLLSFAGLAFTAGLTIAREAIR